MLDVPVYKDNNVGLCGPASLIMVAKYLDESISIDKNLEMEIWKKAVLLPFRFTVGVGLACAASDLNFKAIVYESFFSRFEKYKKVLNEDLIKCETLNNLIDPHISDICYENLVNCAKSRGTIIVEDFLSVDKIRDYLSKNLPVIAMIKVEGWLHWVVVVGVDDHHVYFNDPSYSSVRKMRVHEFEKSMDIFGENVSEALVVYRGDI